MPFMKAVRESKYEDFDSEGAYVCYKRLKVRLHEMKAANTMVTPDEFYEDLVSEKFRIFEWCEAKITEITRVATEIMAQVAPDVAAVFPGVVSEGHKCDTNPDRFRLYADAILYELLRFQECRNLNWDCIERLLLRQQRYTVLPPSKKWSAIHDIYPFQKLPLDDVFYLLQRMYACARRDADVTGDMSVGDGLDKAARAGQEFDRRSIKYWVHDQDMPFVIGRVIQHLPLNVYHDAFCEIKAKEREGIKDVQDYALGSPINSVYFDNKEFLFYHRRLQRLEGSSVLRIRWYESAIRPSAPETSLYTPTRTPEKLVLAPDRSAARKASFRAGNFSPKSTDELMQERSDCIPPNGTVFVELKVHHEMWSGAPSTKRRFPLNNAQVNAFIRGELSLNRSVESLRRSGCSEAEVATFKDLAQEVFAKFNAYELHPVLRTTYSRCAFQRPNDFSVRVSIDTDVSMTAEDFGSGKHWRYLGPDSMTSVQFPYTIVEVKLQYAENERMAPWIEELCTCRMMEAIPKFSKYAHGMASLFGHSSKVKLVPYWINQTSNDIRAATKLENTEWDHTAGLVNGTFQRMADFVVFGSRTPQTRSVGASEAPWHVFLHESGLHRVYQTLAKKQTTQAGIAYVDAPLHLRHEAYTKYGAYAAIQKRALQTGGIPIGNRGSVIPLQSEKRVQVPQKFDPKTIFTSERYFLKWVHHGVVTSAIALASIRFGGFNRLPVPEKASRMFQWQHNLHVMVGVVLMGIAQIMLAYALLVFHARSRRVYARTKISFDDLWGPTWLTLVLAVSIALIGGNYLLLRFLPMITHNSDY